jgi:hypothetical protein
VVPSIAVHAAVLLAIMSSGYASHRAQKTPRPQRIVVSATMTGWIPPLASKDVKPPVATDRARRVARRRLPTTGSARTRVDTVQPAVEAVPAPAKADPPRSDAAAFTPPPSAFQPPAEEKVSLIFVGIEDGEWFRWLAARRGVVGFTSRRDAVIEHVYSAGGESLPVSAVSLADTWALEIDQPERVAAIAGMLAHERDHVGDVSARIRAFALFPSSFQDEVADAVRRTGATSGTLLVSFAGNELRIVVSAPAAATAH